MRHFLRFCVLALLPAVASAKAGTVVYACAHPDDCFLFMSPNFYDDTARDAEKVVILYLTSGDAGMAFSAEDPRAYPNVRERASLDATEWMADAGEAHADTPRKSEVVAIRDHPITRVSYANTVSYFLRLPDGDMSGNGFERYGFGSLRKLKSGEITSLAPIDGAPAYTSWQDFVSVLSGILTREVEGEANVTLHISDPDTHANYNDHSDHTTAASGMVEAAQGSCYRLYKHIDYSIVDKTPNLDGEALQNKAGSFAVLTATQRYFLGTHHWDKAHLPYLTRNYYTIEVKPAGCDRD